MPRALPACAAALGTVLLLPVAAPAQAPPADTGAELEAIEVVGRRQGGSYAADRSGSATRTDTPLRELAQNVKVLGRQLLDDISATRFEETFDYASGVTRQNNFGGLWDNFAIRGFAGDINRGPDYFVNGLSANRGISIPRDTANVERVEFVKGPASALYGRGEPGGIVNIATKQPLDTAARALDLSVGSYQLRRLALDSTGPVADGLSYRLNVAVEDKASFRDTVESDRLLVAPVLAWAPREGLSLTYELEYLRAKSPLDRGVVAVGDRLGAVPASRFLGEPGDGRMTAENLTHQLRGSAEVAADWTLRAALSVKESSLEGFSTEPSSLRPDNRTLWRQRRYRDYETQDLLGQADLVGKLDTGWATHEVLVGAEASRLLNDQVMLRVNPSAARPYAIDIFQPVYGQSAPTPLPNTSTDERLRNLGFYAQDQVGLGEQWRALFSVRWDRFTQTLENRRTGAFSDVERTAWSPRAGLVWLPNEVLSLYASASRSVRPNTGTDALGGGFAPEQGRSYEVGLKAESPDGRWQGTAALFHAKKRDVLTADPVNAGFSVAAGEARSRGLELDLVGELGGGLRLTLAYAFIDAEVTRDNTLRPGTRLLNVPRHSASALAVKEWTLSGDGLVGLGAGVSYVGERTGVSDRNDFILPDYANVKALAYWRVTEAVRLSLDIDNLLDRTYHVSSFSPVWVSPGAPRTVTLGAQVRF